MPDTPVHTWREQKIMNTDAVREKAAAFARLGAELIEAVRVAYAAGADVVRTCPGLCEPAAETMRELDAMNKAITAEISPLAPAFRQAVAVGLAGVAAAAREAVRSAPSTAVLPAFGGDPKQMN